MLQATSDNPELGVKLVVKLITASIQATQVFRVGRSQ